MKKKFVIFSLLFLQYYFCVAQIQAKDSGNIENFKIAYMTRELNLTPEESRKFWPVYGNYFSEIRQARKSYSNDEVAFEERVVQIRKKYKGDFRQILNSDERVNRVFVSEKNLRDLLKKELQNRRLQRQEFNRQPLLKQKRKFNN